MSINLLMLIVSWNIGIGHLFVFKVREQNIQEENQSSLMEEKFKTFQMK